MLTIRLGKYPSPGHKTYVGDMAARPLAGQWQLRAVESAFTGNPWYASTRTVTVGTPAPRMDDEGVDGKNLIYDNYPGYSNGSDDDDDGDSMDTSDKRKREVMQMETQRNRSSGSTSKINTFGDGTERVVRRDLSQGMLQTENPTTHRSHRY